MFDRALRFCGLLAFALSMNMQAESMVWPTPYPAENLTEANLDWVQPTVSGRFESGTFGCVRNDGNRFHEGIDIRPYLEQANGEATDAILAAWTGEIVHINTKVSSSSYGRYIVIEHRQFSPAVITLYSHLATIEKGIAVGDVVKAGERIGKMGRSAGGYVIPKERAHLHFEIGLRISDRFQKWYDARAFETPNEHGLWNGMNLIGLNAWAAWHWLKNNQGHDIGDYTRTLAPGFILRLITTETPDIVERYPSLLTEPIPATGLAGWTITFTGWGFPVAFTPLTGPLEKDAGTATVVAVNSLELDLYGCRQLLTERNGLRSLSDTGIHLVELMFLGAIP